MKYYKSYLERQEISQETHKRLLALGENSLSTGRWRPAVPWPWDWACGIWPNQPRQGDRRLPTPSIQGSKTPTALGRNPRLGSLWQRGLTEKK